MPDPVRSHGAWVSLFVAIGVGALARGPAAVERSLLVGTAFAGGFLFVSALAMGLRRTARRASIGAAVAGGFALAALAFGADSRFLWILAAAAAAGATALAVARRRGFLSRLALSLALAPLASAAPAAAVANGANWIDAAVLFVALWPFLCWRSLLVAASLRGTSHWDRTQLRARGLREAAYAALWGLGVAAVAA